MSHAPIGPKPGDPAGADTDDSLRESPLRRAAHRLLAPQVLFPILALVSLAFLWGATAKLAQVERSGALETVRASTTEHLDTYEAQVVRAVREIDQTLRSVQYAYELRGDGGAALADLRSRGMLPPEVVFTVRVLGIEGGPDARGAEALVDSLAVGPPVVSADPEAGNWRLRFSRPVFADDGSAAGIAVVEVDAAFFVSGYDPADLGEHGVLAVLGTDGIFRARRTGDDVSAGRLVDYETILQGQALADAGLRLWENPWDHVVRYTSARKLYGYPLAVVAGVSRDEQLAATEARIAAYGRRAAAASVLLLLVIAALGRANWKLARLRRREAEAEVAHARRIRHLAFHDSLTGLPNRALFTQLLERAVSLSRRYGHQLGVFFLDLDGFKDVNDTLGHDAGDQLLRQVAERLEEALRESDTIARMGGDEFVVLAPELDGEGGAELIAVRMLTALREPFEVMGRPIRVTGSVGAAMYPRDGDDESTLLKHSDIAMYAAKEGGKNDFRFYSAEMGSGSIERLALAASLRLALENREFDLHYQARRDMRTGRITCMEALLRWHHPELGTVEPLQFFPLAEEIGLTLPIGRWVLESACRQSVAWQEAGLPRVAVAVNVTARQFFDERLPKDVDSALERTGLEPRLLELEVAENVLTRDVSRSVEILEGLKKLGVKITIDNFGTGYSSLAVLRHLPLDSIKVDRVFIQDSSRNRMEREVADAILMMGRALSRSLHADGVETREQLEYLKAHACDEVQGYYFDLPLPASQVEALFREPGTDAADGSAGTAVVSTLGA